MNANDIVGSVSHLIPDSANKEWSQLPKEDMQVVCYWLDKRLKYGLIRMFNEFGNQLLEDKSLEITEVSAILSAQQEIASCIGMIEVFIYNNTKGEN